MGADIGVTRGSLPEQVSVREVGMRDGLQLEAPMSTEDKLQMLEALVATGVKRIEVTSFVSPTAVPALADADRVAAHLHRWPGVRWSAVILNARGAHRAMAAGIDEVEFVVSAGEGHSRANAGMSTEQAIEQMREAAAVVRQHGRGFELVVATAWDCPFSGRTPPRRVIDIVASARRAGIDRICLADTIGTVTPLRLTELVSAVTAACGQPPALHLHNTYGAGAANALAAVQVGVVEFDSSIGGLGGCPFAPGASGNIATEELIYLFHECGVRTDLDYGATIRAVQVTQDLLGRPLGSGPLAASLARGAMSLRP